MEEEIREFIQGSSFPCIMAKAVAAKGLLRVKTVSDLKNTQSILKNIWEFIDEMRSNENRLSSFILVIKNDHLNKFGMFENAVWKFLSELHREDKFTWPHDPRVSSDPKDDKFGYSLKSEAFFIVAMHPESPRWARRFRYPALVFNPHKQFENLRAKGIFKKVRDIIRQKDKLFQGSINPMLSDFGEKSEIFQYMGRIYAPNENIPLTL